MNTEPDEEAIARFQCAHPNEAESLYLEGIAYERDRITALLKLSHPATSHLVAEAIKRGKDASEIFDLCFRARERSQGTAAASRPAANRLSPRAEVPSPAAPEPPPASSDTEHFSRTLRMKMASARIHWHLKGSAKREALAVVTAR